MPTTVHTRPAPVKSRPSFETHHEADWQAALFDVERPLWFVRGESGPQLTDGNGAPPDFVAYVPSIRPEQLGHAGFRQDHRIRYAYVAGAMANGIASVELVTEMSRAGMLSFFGAAGLSIERVAAAIDRLQVLLGNAPFGCNFIHSPHETATEAALAELLIRRGIKLVEASAFLDLTLPLVRYRLHGIYQRPDGRVEAPNRVIAKVSRIEVAAKFLSPPPAKMIQELVANGTLTPAQAAMAAQIPVAQDLTVEADSGGHTDNRPLVALLPTILALRERIQKQFQYSQELRVGAAGGISTPASVAAAFALGADYVVTGSINQACRESGSSDAVRRMLAGVQQADVIMAPAADMFEMGVKVQVMKRGTMFAMRAARLYEIYRAYDNIESLPLSERAKLEKEIFRQPLDEIWRQTAEFWKKRDASQWDRAEQDPKHKMALMFRWYLGLSSRWANSGEPDRQMDYQVWCGPAMGAFNEWTRGSELEQPENRRVADVARALMHGAAVQTRINILKAQGVAIPPQVAHVPPIIPNDD